MEKITLLHTNDLHSHFENWPKIRRFLEQRKAALESQGQTVITVDLGDFVDRWHPLTEATNGQGNIALMNQVAYDAITIGNNEGVGNAKEDLNQLYQNAQADVLLANLFDKKTLAAPDWSRRYKIIETPAGTRVGLIALTAPFPLTYSPNGWDIRFPIDILPGLIKEVRPQVDVLVLMSHLGIEDDYFIGETFPQIDVILGSHTHHLFETGKKLGHVQLAAAGKFGQYVGEVTLTLNQEKVIQNSQAQAIPTEEMLAFPEDQEEIAGFFEEGHRLLGERVVAKIPFSMTQDLNQEHPLIKEALKAVKVRGETEVAILSSGLVLMDIPQGFVNHDQLHQALPHPMHLIRVKMLGADVIRMVLEMEKNRNFLRNFPMIGMGFRGKIFGQIVYDGLEFDGVNRQVAWLGKPIEATKSYTFTTVDHFLFVPFFPSIEIAGEYEVLFPEFIRSVLGEYLQTHYPRETKQGIIKH